MITIKKEQYTFPHTDIECRYEGDHWECKLYLDPIASTWEKYDVLIYTVLMFETNEIPAYSELVSGIVKYRYDSDKIEAITLNYLDRDNMTDEKREEAENDMKSLQMWRTESKTMANKLLSIVLEVNKTISF